MPYSVFSLFLSSTSQDLGPCRAKVKEMIERIACDHRGHGDLRGAPRQAVRHVPRRVQKCDALIVIVGHRYGWVPSKGDGVDGKKSITWWEVQWALDVAAEPGQPLPPLSPPVADYVPLSEPDQLF
jgi:Domain of unknown function (DUF4062)